MPCWVDRVVAVGFFCALRARVGISIACKADVQEAVVLRAGCCLRVNSVAAPLGRGEEVIPLPLSLSAEEGFLAG